MQVSDKSVTDLSKIGTNETEISSSNLSNEGNNVIESEDDYVLKAGSTMTGYLTLSGDPTNSLHAATQQYVDDNEIGSQFDAFVPDDYPTPYSAIRDGKQNIYVKSGVYVDVFTNVETLSTPFRVVGENRENVTWILRLECNSSAGAIQPTLNCNKMWFENTTIVFSNMYNCYARVFNFGNNGNNYNLNLRIANCKLYWPITGLWKPEFAALIGTPGLFNVQFVNSTFKNDDLTFGHTMIYDVSDHNFHPESSLIYDNVQILDHRAYRVIWSYIPHVTIRNVYISIDKDYSNDNNSFLCIIYNSQVTIDGLEIDAPNAGASTAFYFNKCSKVRISNSSINAGKGFSYGTFRFYNNSSNIIITSSKFNCANDRFLFMDNYTNTNKQFLTGCVLYNADVNNLTNIGDRFVLRNNVINGVAHSGYDTALTNSPDGLADTNIVWVSISSGDETTGDGSMGKPYKTLSQSIINDSYDKTIFICPGQYDLNDDLEINGDIAIKGFGNREDIFLNSINDQKRIFTVNSGNVLIENMKMTSKNDNYWGGAVLGSECTTVQLCIFDSCEATWYGGGGMSGGTANNCIFTNCVGYYSGGMYGDDYGSMPEGVARNCTFIDCCATSLDGGGMYGGSAWNCTFKYCHAEHGGGIMYGDAYYCTFKNCSASEDGDAMFATGTKFCIVDNCGSEPVSSGTHVGLIIDEQLQLGSQDIGTETVTTTNIQNSAVTSEKILNNTITINDLDISSIDTRYISKTETGNQTMSGSLTAPQINVSNNWIVGSGGATKQVIAINNEAAESITWTSGTTNAVTHGLGIIGNYIVLITPTSDMNCNYYISNKSENSFTITTKGSYFNFDYLIIKK